LGLPEIGSGALKREIRCLFRRPFRRYPLPFPASLAAPTTNGTEAPPARGL